MLEKGLILTWKGRETTSLHWHGVVLYVCLLFGVKTKEYEKKRIIMNICVKGRITPNKLSKDQPHLVMIGDICINE